MALLNAGTGTDGDAIVSADTNLNTQSLVGRAYPDMVAYEVASLNAGGCTINGAPNGLAAGDSILLINLQGAGVDQVDNAGNFEILKVGNINGSNITFENEKTKYYGNNGGDSNIGLTNETNHTVMIQRLPQYNNLTVNSGQTLTCNKWDLNRYGILALMCKETLTVNGTISALGKGYLAPADDARYWKGGSYGRRAFGGTYYNQPNNQGGGGGGEAQKRGGGGAYGVDVPGVNGGDPYGSADLTKLFMGSAGGNTYASFGERRGMDGGGAIALFCNEINVLGTIDAGSDPTLGWRQYDEWSGGGAGGSILVQAGLVNFNSSIIKSLPSFNGSVGRIAVYYNTLQGTFGPFNPAPYTSDTVEMPYKVNGNMTTPCEVRIYTQDWTLVSTQSFSPGPWEIGGLPSTGPFNIIADPNASNENILGFKDITAIQ